MFAVMQRVARVRQRQLILVNVSSRSTALVVDYHLDGRPSVLPNVTSCRDLGVMLTRDQFSSAHINDSAFHPPWDGKMSISFRAE